MNNLTPDQLTLEAFTPWVKTKFRARLDPSSFVEVELEEAKAIVFPASAPLTKNGLAQEAFSLIFQGPDNRLLPQRIYAFEHDEMGQFDLFIVPIKQQSGCIQYQAIFNRLTKPA